MCTESTMGVRLSSWAEDEIMSLSEENASLRDRLIALEAVADAARELTDTFEFWRWESERFGGAGEYAEAYDRLRDALAKLKEEG